LFVSIKFAYMSQSSVLEVWIGLRWELSLFWGNWYVLFPPYI
jgi:hypothetical protein